MHPNFINIHKKNSHLSCIFPYCGIIVYCRFPYIINITKISGSSYVSLDALGVSENPNSGWLESHIAVSVESEHHQDSHLKMQLWTTLWNYIVGCNGWMGIWGI